MNVEVLSQGVQQEHYHPLTVDRPLDRCSVGGTTFREACTAEFEAVGWSPSEHSKTTLTLQVHGNVWLHRRDLRRILQLDQPTAIKDAAGEILAWTAQGTLVDDSLPLLKARHSLMIRYPWDLLTLNEILLERVTQSQVEGTLSRGAHVDGCLIAGKQTRILPGTYIEGNVVIGDYAKIGPNAYLRGPLSIGDGCHIGNAVEVKGSIIMDRVSIGHLSYVGDSIIADNVNFGAGTIVANLRHDGRHHRSPVGGAMVDTGRRKLGAIIGHDVHTGINTSIYPGRKLWPRLGTNPAEVVDRDKRLRP